QPRFPLAGEADSRAILYPGGNIDRERAFFRDAPLAMAFAAWILDRLTAPAALRTGALDGKEALRRTDPAGTAAHAARDGRRAWTGAASRAFVTLHCGWHPNLGRLAGEAFLERDFHIVAQVSPALAAIRLAAMPPAHHLTENIFENIGKTAAAKPAIEAAAHASLFEGSVAETVISSTLLRVLERVVSFADFLELALGFRIARISIGMILHRQTTICAFQRSGVRIAL